MKSWVLAGLWALGLVPCLSAQGFPFLIRVERPDAATLVSNGAAISVNAPIGQEETLTISLTYSGQGSSVIRSAPQVNGSNAFQIASSDATPANLANGQTFRFTVRYLPQRAQAVGSQISMPVSESITAGNGATVTTQTFFLLQLQGTAPDLVVNYITSELQSYIPLADGGSIPFSATPLGFANTLLVSVINRGSGPAELSSVAVLGPEFQPVGLGLLPSPLAANAEIRFTLRFQPNAEGTRTGRLLLATSGGNLSLNLTGEAFQIRFAYEVVQPSGVTEIQPGSTIGLGEALPGETQSAQVLVRNINPITVALPTVAVFGTGFNLSENPGTRNLRAGESVSFFLNAQAPQNGLQRGRLRVGDDAFDLVIAASGAQLRYSYAVAGSDPVPVASGGSVFFSPTQIGSNQTALFTVRNAGLSEATLINISSADTGAVFSLLDLPPLPAKVQPGETLSFVVRFRPAAAGLSSSVLRLDGATFSLNGTASSLPPLPPYRFSLNSGNVEALSQPSVGLQLDAAYPSPLRGTLLLSQEAAGFVTDPSVRFANGGASVNFTIPANTTQAIFPNGSNLIRFQTGSVAGVLLLQATFSVAGTTLEESNPQTVRLTIPATPPRILAATATPSGNASILVSITGLVLSRSITRLQLDLTPTPGFNLSATRFNINLEGESLAWFRSTASQGTGGVFQLLVPLNLAIGGNTSGAGVSNLLDAITSISVTLNNEIGASAPSAIQLRP